MEPYQSLSRSIAGKVAIITGAASGMGRATAHLFASEGAHVAVTDLDQGKCDAVVQEIEAAGYPGSAKAWALEFVLTGQLEINWVDKDSPQVVDADSPQVVDADSGGSV